MTPPPSQHLLELLEAEIITQEDYNTITKEVKTNHHISSTPSSAIAASGVTAIVDNITICHTTPRYSELHAVSKVFNTAELLECILTYLGSYPLILAAPRVCKGFRRVIESSLALQRLTFRAPRLGGELECLLDEHMRPLRPFKPLRTVRNEHRGFGVGPYIVFQVPVHFVLSFVQNSPTLQKALLVQPPAREVWVTASASDVWGRVEFILGAQNGVTWGELGRFVRKNCSPKDKPYSFLDVTVIAQGRVERQGNWRKVGVSQRVTYCEPRPEKETC
ncbi:hypothetical protein B0A50_01908 [Salinomyces thailandicus]|uniref:F-box domain-containing protein n=1 Tax=Salinomyces thailandicus TaxID=706561 RepID=A0A4V5N5H3_9PEZI|nr:hypothetical protein B0A50_01908 [Salinomyces thailandica]